MGDLDLRTVLLLLVAVGALAAAWYIARSAPRLVVAGWAAVCFLVPIWVGVQAGVYWSAVTAVTIVALAAWSTDALTFSYVDVLVVGFVLLVLAAYLVGGSTWGHVLIVLFGWLVPYVWGRFVLVRVEARVAVRVHRRRRDRRRRARHHRVRHRLQPLRRDRHAERRMAHLARAAAEGRVRPSRGRLRPLDRLRERPGDEHGVRDRDPVARPRTPRLPRGDRHRGGHELQPHRPDHARDLARARRAPARPMDDAGDARGGRGPARRRELPSPFPCSATCSPLRARRPAAARSTARTS